MITIKKDKAGGGDKSPLLYNMNLKTKPLPRLLHKSFP